MYFLFKMVMFHWYVSLPEGNVKKNGYEMGNIPEI